jgi:hypothetical protein
MLARPRFLLAADQVTIFPVDPSALKLSPFHSMRHNQSAKSAKRLSSSSAAESAKTL